MSSVRDVHLHLVPRLRMSGVVPLLPLHGFMAWTGTTVLLQDAQSSDVKYGAEELAG
jgi:hypothetical protein